VFVEIFAVHPWQIDACITVMCGRIQNKTKGLKPTHFKNDHANTPWFSSDPNNITWTQSSGGRGRGSNRTWVQTRQLNQVWNLKSNQS